MRPGQDLPATGHLAWLLVCRPENLDEASQKLLVHMRQQPLITKAHELAQTFAAMLRDRQPQQLEAWLGRAESSTALDLLQCATGLRKDLVAVRAALTLPWSSYSIEGSRSLPSPGQTQPPIC
jgi:transposase